MRPSAPRSRSADALSLVVATALTAGAVAVALGGLVPRVMVATRDPSPPAYERIAWTPPAPRPSPPSRAPPAPVPPPGAAAVATPRAPAVAPTGIGVAPSVGPAAAAPPRDTASRGARRDPARVADGLRPAPPAVALRAPVAPVPRADDRIAQGLGGAPVVDGRALGGATVGLARVPLSRDSAWAGNRGRLEQLAMGSRRAPLPPTAEERDAAWRAQAAALRAAPGGAPPVTAPGGAGGAGISVGVGLPGGGPSNAQRARDRATHAENLAMIGRLAQRADSVCEVRRRRADSLRTVARDERAAARERDTLRGCKG